MIEKFISECTFRNPRGRLKPMEIYRRYEKWAEENNIDFIEGLSTFGKIFLNSSPYENRIVHGSRIYVGIGLKK